MAMPVALDPVPVRHISAALDAIAPGVLQMKDIMQINLNLNRAVLAICGLLLPFFAQAACTDHAKPYVEWSGCNKQGAHLMGAYLERANLSGANLAGADLEAANLHKANLSGANLAQVVLAGADLERANLSGANLAGADLAGANLYRANVAGANLAGANLEGAIWHDGERCARGSVGTCN